MTYEEAKTIKTQLELAVNNARKKFPKSRINSVGLHTDEVKATVEWKQARQEYNLCFEALRKFNQTYVKVFKKEISSDRDNKLKGLRK